MLFSQRGVNQTLWLHDANKQQTNTEQNQECMSKKRETLGIYRKYIVNGGIIENKNILEVMK